MARIAVGGFHHETNTFVATKTDFAYFCLHRDRPPYVRRAAVLEWLGSVRYPLSGFMAATKGLLVPKSVVRVMIESAMCGTAAGGAWVWRL